MRQHPIHSLLTPDPADSILPAGFVRLRAALPQGLPTPLDVPGLGLTLLLSAPTARVRAWLEADPATVAADAAPQRAPALPLQLGEDPRAALAPVLILCRGKSPVAVMPLLVNARTLLPRAGEQPGDSVELVILSFLITAEAMRGPRAGASFVEFAWRPLSAGTDSFMAPVARPALRRRLVATTGVGADRLRRSVAPELYTDTGEVAGAEVEPGGINWRLTHG